MGEESGEFGTTDYVMTFKDGDKTISPRHDIPLEAGDGLYNMLTEIPKMTLKKMEVATKAEVNGCFGDNDPLDVVEIGGASLSMGSITPVKPLGVLSMIDDGELDWKPIAIAASDEKAAEINDVDDIEKFYPGTVSGIREWFRWYKTPDDKPVNAFGHGEKALGAAEAVEVIKETNEFYKNLMEGKTEAGKLWLK